MSDNLLKIYQFKIILLDSEPVVWRRVQVPERYTFRDMHMVIQIAMGWNMSHCHKFEVLIETSAGPKVIGMTTGGSNKNVISEDTAKLCEYFTSSGSKVVYIYDFGDEWEHEIILEEILEATENMKYPRCVGGERACPPDNSGGVVGYSNLLHVLADSDRLEHNKMQKWLETRGKKPFNPEKFDPTKIKF